MSKMLLPRFLAFPVLAFVGQWYWMRYYAPDDASALFWIPFLTYCWFCVGGLSHELIHHNLPFGPRVTRVLGRAIGTAIGIPYSVYREVHMRHHAYLNTPLDWELWPYSDPGVSLRFRRIFIWFDMLCGTLATPLIWSRICFSKASPVKPEQRREMQQEYLGIALTLLGLITVLVWVFTKGGKQFEVAMLLYVLPQILAANCNSIRKIMEHVGTRSFDPLLGTRTIVGGNPLTRLLSYFDFDLAVHGPHHRFPKLDHTSLESRMNEIQQDHPEQCYPVFRSFTGALLHTMRTAIVNPGVGINAGCTDDLGHLPGLAESVPTENGEPVLAAAESSAVGVNSCDS